MQGGRQCRAQSTHRQAWLVALGGRGVIEGYLDWVEHDVVGEDGERGGEVAFVSILNLFVGDGARG